MAPHQQTATVYYTLVRKELAEVGEVARAFVEERRGPYITTEVGSEEVWVGTDPRRLPLLDITGDYCSPDELNADWRLVTLTPTGPVGQDEEGHQTADEWRIATVEDNRLVLGPQADLLIAAGQVGEEKLNTGLFEAGSAEEVFDAAVNAQYEGDARERRRDVEEALERALDGGSVLWLGNDVYGLPLAGLAARDLIGTVDGWDQDAYDFATKPWLEALGPIHPDDQLATTSVG
jgi:hypothetical protein